MTHLHFIGIGGTAMANAALALRDTGVRITGSDTALYPPMSTMLETEGIEWWEGFDPAHLDPVPDLVVVGNAISRGNPELEAVLTRRMPFTSLAALVGERLIAGHRSVVVAGTHGKTTTSSLIAWILESAGRAPGFLIGGLPRNFGRGCRPAREQGIFVSEGDEYDTAFFDKRSKFLHYRPDLFLINNVEFDHADIFSSLDEVKRSFRHGVAIVPGSGHILVNGDDENALAVSRQSHTPIETFGFGTSCMWRAEERHSDARGLTFTLVHPGEDSVVISAPLSGEHNIRNVLAATVACRLLGLRIEEIHTGLQSFLNVRRRLEVRIDTPRALLIDDFAHHPTAIAATLAAVRAAWPHRPVTACFEPRSNTSTRRLFQAELTEALSTADRVIIGAVNRPDRYAPEDMLDVPRLCADLSDRGCSARSLPDAQDILAWLAANPVPGEILLLLSNGQFGGLPQRIEDALREERL